MLRFARLLSVKRSSCCPLASQQRDRGRREQKRSKRERERENEGKMLTCQKFRAWKGQTTSSSSEYNSKKGKDREKTVKDRSGEKPGLMYEETGGLSDACRAPFRARHTRPKRGEACRNACGQRVGATPQSHLLGRCNNKRKATFLLDPTATTTPSAASPVALLRRTSRRHITDNHWQRVLAFTTQQQSKERCETSCCLGPISVCRLVSVSVSVSSGLQPMAVLSLT